MWSALRSVMARLFMIRSRICRTCPAQLTLRCEQAIRNYDPCISCATHFLRLEVTRE
jgi:coenzyme F420-reducing hydrogenase alpha subunit